MANYRFALKLHQDQAGSENTKAKITIGSNVVVEELEISATTPTLYTYDVTGLADVNADGSVTTPVKVELLNDYYVDENTDRNIIWTACGYVQENADGNYYNPTATTDDGTSWTWANVAISDFTAESAYVWENQPPFTGDIQSGPQGDYSDWWYQIMISQAHCEAPIRLTAAGSDVYINNS
jgi:hypothetical protein